MSSTSHSEEPHPAPTHSTSSVPPPLGQEMPSRVSTEQSRVSRTEHGTDFICSYSARITPSAPESPFRLPPLFSRLGRYLLITNIGAILLLFASLLILFFLWFADERNHNWRRVMVSGWIDQAVTLSTLAIRLAVAIQGSTAVAMLAAISFESTKRGGVLLAETPAISFARYVNTGPLTSFLVFWNNTSWPRCGPVLPFLGVFAICSSVSQFTSTLLLWDVRSGVTQGFPSTTSQPAGISMEGFLNRFWTTMQRGSNYWQSSPQTFPTFAEWNAKPQENANFIVDTGPTIRAFLPVNELGRSMLTDFNGIAAAFDARVACIRPEFFNWSIHVDDDGFQYFTSLVRPKNLTEELRSMLRYNESETGIPVRCLLGGMEVHADPIFKICFINYAQGGFINSLDHTSNASMHQFFPEYESDVYSFYPTWVAPDNESLQQWPVETGHTFLLFRSAGKAQERVLPWWMTKGTRPVVTQDGIWTQFSPPSNWTRIAGMADTSGMDSLKVTLCYDALYNHGGENQRIKHLQQFPISASRQTNNSEPVLSWDANGASFDTTAVRNQLGANGQERNDRGTLELDMNSLRRTLKEYSQQWSPDVNVTCTEAEYKLITWFLNTSAQIAHKQEMHKVFNASTLFGEFGYRTNETYDFLNTVAWWSLNNYNLEADPDHFEVYAPCENCSSYLLFEKPEDIAYQVLNPILNAIFRDTIIETDNPALAWQALITAVLRMAYYDWLQTFDTNSDITTISKVQCQVPKHFFGFTVVMINLLLHLGFFLTTALWFSKETKTSLLNNSWQTIAQLKCEEVEDLLGDATMAEDKKVKKQAGEGQKPQRRYKVARCEQCGRAHLLRR